MKKTMMSAALCLVLAACGGGADEAASTTADLGSTDGSTAVEATTSSVAAETTTTAAETTTTEPDTTTTAAIVGSDGLEALISKMDQAGEMTSARIEGTMEMYGLSTEDGVSDVVLPFSTTFDTLTGDMAMRMDMSGIAGSADLTGEDAAMAAAFLGEIEMRQIGDRAYIKMPFLTAMLGTDAEWVSMPADEAGDFSSDMGVQTDPNEMLDDYRKADAQVEELGVESVNGVDATHYQVIVDTELWLESLTAEERAELEADGPIPISDFPMDLWITDDGFLVRMVMEIDGSQVIDDSGDSFERMVLTYNVFDINQPVDITAPDEFVDMDDLGEGFGFDSN